MKKGGKLTKLKSVIKKWQSKSKLGSGGRTNGSSISAAEEEEEGIGTGLQLKAVYVGRSRRRYLIKSDMMDHPLVQELVERSAESEALTVGCEVVLFEHLLWMLENADPQPDSLDELLHFYAS